MAKVVIVAWSSILTELTTYRSAVPYGIVFVEDHL
jgi:hypothetical protein